MVHDYRLVADLGPCTGSGLKLRGRVVFEGNGHTIRGMGNAKTFGLVLDRSANGSEVLNVEVIGFERGIRLAGVQRSHLFKVHSHHNGRNVEHVGYGIDVAGGASDNVIEKADVHDNADEGIHVGTDSRNNRISDSSSHDNFRENVYFLQNAGNVLERSHVYGGGAAGVYVKHAQGTHIVDTEVRDRSINVRGASTDTLIARTTLRGAPLVIEPYNDPKLGFVKPARTTMHGGSIQSPELCLKVLAGTAITLEEVRLECPVAVSLTADSDVTAVATPIGRVTCHGAGTINRAGRIDVRFVDQAGKPVPSVEMRVAGGAAGLAGAVADASGKFNGFLVTSRESCPSIGGVPTSDSDEVVVSAGTRSRRLKVSELQGEIDLDSDSAPAAGSRRRAQ